ncbi:unnamed protein product [Notodromas monacha]|uniref:Poly [ADP-ribose] polymerase n=1 Tax=Notodromas monacha TaxID=399045 RepID=A0A7R9GGU3_9CRUS|nr:unnamed protein product [Notodromas monacha]CAG0920786.1 unnamed protein product [Notodromas monacha]
MRQTRRNTLTPAPAAPKQNKKRPARSKVTEEKEEDEPVDYESMKLPELKKCCENLGLDSKGKKADLVKRLLDSSKAASSPQKSKRRKKTEEEPKAQDSVQTAFEALKSQGPQKRKSFKVDEKCSINNHVDVYEDYDCMLNQTNIGQNNNKYYVVQLLRGKSGGMYWTWNRWGRVGEPGAVSLKSFGSNLNGAIADFEKKFKDKTGNHWGNRDNFVPIDKKYTLLDMGDEDEDEPDSSKVEKSSNGAKTKPCSLDPHVKELMELIFDTDMFANTMKDLNIGKFFLKSTAAKMNVKKMPLGKLSKQQIAKGFDALVELENAIKAKKVSYFFHFNHVKKYDFNFHTVRKQGTKVYQELSSKFYTLIPHDFKRSRPETIETEEKVQAKKDMLIVLSDIEIAQSIEKEQEAEKQSKSSADLPPHPLDVKYKKLDCDLRRIDPTEKVYEIIKCYKEATNKIWKIPIVNIYEMTRKGEVTRFMRSDSIAYRKLLWHGTKVAVVAAILQGGLRIMPHSGGRVGRGIYFASENEKSAGYVGPSGGWGWGVAANSAKLQQKNIGIMFLAEVALGKEKNITKDDPSLTKPPVGYDSVVARGSGEPVHPHQQSFLRGFPGRNLVVSSSRESKSKTH